jgi:hypothetical protein
MTPPDGRVRLAKTYYSRFGPSVYVQAEYELTRPLENVGSYYDKRFQTDGWSRCAAGRLFFMEFHKYKKGDSIAALSFSPEGPVSQYSIDFTREVPNPC